MLYPSTVSFALSSHPHIQVENRQEGKFATHSICQINTNKRVTENTQGSAELGEIVWLRMKDLMAGGNFCKYLCDGVALAVIRLSDS